VRFWGGGGRAQTFNPGQKSEAVNNPGPQETLDFLGLQRLQEPLESHLNCDGEPMQVTAYATAIISGMMHSYSAANCMC